MSPHDDAAPAESHRLDFLVSGIGKTGPTAEFVAAESAREALATFTAQGVTDVTLHDDEIAATVRAINKAEAAEAQAVAPMPPPMTAVQSRLRPVAGWIRTLYAIPQIARYIGYVVVFVTAFILGWPWWAFVILFVVALLIDVLTAATRTVVVYDRLLQALHAGRGDEALALIDQLERALETTKTRHAVGSLELWARRAQALALLGHRDDALRFVERIREDLPTPDWMYWVHRFVVLWLLGDRHGALDAAKRFLEAGPDCATKRIDAARIALFVDDPDPDVAEQNLNAIEALPVPSGLTPCIAVFRGLVALERGEHEAARKALEALADDPILSLSPMTWLRQYTLAGLAVAHAGLDQPDQSRHYAEQVLPAFEARREHRWVERLKSLRAAA